MFDVKVLSKADTEKLLKMEDVINVVDGVYRQKAEAKTSVFPMVFHEFNPGVADMDIKSGWLKDSGIFGLKLVSWYGENPEKNLPALIGTVMVFDDKTGRPLGLLDGSHITGMRTGAAGALGAKYLARPDSENLLVVGAGHVATFQIAAMCCLFPKLKKIMIYDASDEAAVKLAAQIPDTLAKMNITVPDGASLSATRDIADAAAAADIIITVTPAREPIIKKEWVKPGTHLSCVGADLTGKEEIDPALFQGSRVFADDILQCLKVGELEIPFKTGFIKECDLAGELGDIAIGKTAGRQSDEQITIFDTSGIALLDLATAQLAFKAAEGTNTGSSVLL